MAGFFIVGAFYFLLAIALHQFGGKAMRNRFTQAIINSLMK
jgi:hypothetical protein